MDLSSPWLGHQQQLSLPTPRWRWPLLLFLLTAASTTLVGARLAYNFARAVPAYANATDIFPYAWAWHHPRWWIAGLPFSLALMAILSAHELGHYLACRRYRLDSTLPLFLPTPTLVGTMGAFIYIRTPFLSRRSLFDVGIAGPLAGMALALPLLLWGLLQSPPLAPAQAAAWNQAWIHLGWPVLGRCIAAALHPGQAVTHLRIAPLARAAWVGLLLTMLNLIPAAQLDGGHILYAVAPAWHRMVSWASLPLLLAAGWFYWPGWYVFAAFIALMRVRHPWVPLDLPLGWRRGLLALLALAVFLLTFTLAPVLA